MTRSVSQTVFSPWLSPVRAVSTTNIAATYNNGPSNNGVGATLTVAASSLTVDGVALAQGDRVLLLGQTTSYQNGVYVVQLIASSVVLQRSDDQQNIEQLKPGQNLFVGAGTANGGAYFTLCEPIPQAIGVDSFVWKLAADLVASVAVTATEFNGMYAAPKLLVPAPGANKLLVVDRVELVMTYGSAAYASGGVVAVQWDSTINGAGVIASTTVAAAAFQATASNTFLMNGGVVTAPFATTVNKGLYLSNITGAFTTGDSPFVVKVHYHVVATA
jgi:hypothetical protein